MSTRTFQTNQFVRFKYGTRTVQGLVKEDRGPIGRDGRVLYLVEFRPDPHSTDVSHIELPAEKLNAVDHVASESS